MKVVLIILFLVGCRTVKPESVRTADLAQSPVSPTTLRPYCWFGPPQTMWFTDGGTVYSLIDTIKIIRVHRFPVLHYDGAHIRIKIFKINVDSVNHEN